MQETQTMSDKLVSDTESRGVANNPPGFLKRYRLPLFLAVVALCLYGGSILYILFVRGPVA